LAAYQTTVADDERAVTSLLFYILAYTFMNIGAFGVVAWLPAPGPRPDPRLTSAAWPRPSRWRRRRMTVFLISLMGIPPTIGFYAKYYVIEAAIASGDSASAWRSRSSFSPPSPPSTTCAWWP
jgi:NADH-quinone oxidoreductase subunit N